MMNKKKPMSYQAGGMVFKPCAACPNPAKCAAAGKCLKRASKGKSKTGSAGGGLAAPAGRSAKVS